MALSFLFGGNTGETPETLKRKRELAMALMGAHQAPKTVGEGLNALGAGIAAGVMNRRADKSEKAGTESANALFQKIIGGSPAPSVTPGGGQPSVGGSAASAPINMSGNDVYSGFMDTVKTKITNPFGLAAVAATGKAESGFSPGNVNRTWSDPSESGKPGTAGGIMSWRGPRYDALAATGDLSPEGQAKFFLQENPQLIEGLNNAKSVEEAQQLMNRAWAFAGYDRPGGEAANRLGYANSFLPQFQGQQQPPQEVASLDPSIGMPNTAAEAVTAMGQGGQPQSFNPQGAAGAGAGASAAASPFLPSGVPLSEDAFDQRFGQTPLPGQQNVGPGALSAALTESNQVMANPSQIPAQSSPFAPPIQQQPAPVEVAQATQPEPQQAVQQPPPEVDRRLYELIANPFASEEMKAVARLQLEQQMQAQQTFQNEQLWRQRQDYEAQLQNRDPLRQAQIEKYRADAEKAKTGGDVSYGLSPVWGEDEKGNPVLGVLGNNGTFKRIDTGEFKPSKGVEYRDMGDRVDMFDKQSGAYIGSQPKGLQEAERQKAVGSGEGKAQAETQSEYNSITSKMPGLYSVVDRLDDLAQDATYTLTGQGVDFVRKELGMSPREAAVARAEYTAVVDNQILPLLRDTFGAQFTAEEGQRLARTLGDPDKSPTEKSALLRAFIQQKERDIKALATRLQPDGPTQSGAKKSTRIGGYTIEEE